MEKYFLAWNEVNVFLIINQLDLISVDSINREIYFTDNICNAPTNTNEFNVLQDLTEEGLVIQNDILISDGVNTSLLISFINEIKIN